MKNNIFKGIFLTLVLFFLVLYITQALGYYEYSNRKTNIMTEEAKEKFEQDIENGKTINASDYIKKENDYSNKMSRLGLRISNAIGDAFDGIMSFIFYEASKTVNS